MLWTGDDSNRCGRNFMVAYRAIDIVMDVLARRASETESKLDDSLVPLFRTSVRLFVTFVGILLFYKTLISTFHL